jgi:hypothetical protein
MKRILLLIVSLCCFQVFLSQENLIKNTENLSNFEILSKYDIELALINKGEFFFLIKNENKIELYKTSKLKKN